MQKLTSETATGPVAGRMEAEARTLRNGALVIESAYNGDIEYVLAVYGPEEDREYVTWAVDRIGNAYWGHYFQRNLAAAVNDFMQRIGEV